MARELKRIYNAESAEAAAKRLEEFANGERGKKLPSIVQSWRRAWEQVIPFFAYPLEIRKIIYTTNAIESLHMQLRKVLKNRVPAETSRNRKRCFGFGFGCSLRQPKIKVEEIKDVLAMQGGGSFGQQVKVQLRKGASDLAVTVIPCSS